MKKDSAPHVEPVETAVVCIMLKDGDFIGRAVSDGITADHFHVPQLRRCFELLVELHDTGEPTDDTSFYGYVLSQGADDEVGGTSFIATLSSGSAPIASWSHYVVSLSKAYAQRTAQRELQHIARMAPTTSPEHIAALAREVSDRVTSIFTHRKAIHKAKECVDDWLARYEAMFAAGDLPGSSTGIPELDAATGGLRPGELWVVSAVTSGGKSVMCLQIAAAHLRAGKNVLVVTLELRKDEIIARLISHMGRISYGALTNPKQYHNKGILAKLQRLALEIKATGLFVIDTADLTVEHIISQAKELNETNKLDLIVVDYLQLIDGNRSKGESREQEVARISRRLKQAAKALDCPIVTPSQLNDDGKLRESRAIGHDCDNHVMIYPERVKMDKARNAPRGTILPLVLNGELQRFDTATAESVAEPENEPEDRRSRGGYRRGGRGQY